MQLRYTKIYVANYCHLTIVMKDRDLVLGQCKNLQRHLQKYFSTHHLLQSSFHRHLQTFLKQLIQLRAKQPVYTTAPPNSNEKKNATRGRISTRQRKVLLNLMTLHLLITERQSVELSRKVLGSAADMT